MLHPRGSLDASRSAPNAGDQRLFRVRSMWLAVVAHREPGLRLEEVEWRGAALSRSDGGSQRSAGHRGGRALWSFTQDGPHLEASLSRRRSAGSRGSLASTAPPSLAALGGDRSAHLQAAQGTSSLGAAQAASRTRQTWRRPASVVVERLSRPGEKPPRRGASAQTPARGLRQLGARATPWSCGSSTSRAASCC